MAEKKIGDIQIGVIFETRAAAQAIRIISEALQRVKGESDADTSALDKLGAELESLQTSGKGAAAGVSGATEQIKHQEKSTTGLLDRMAKLNLAYEGAMRMYNQFKNRIGEMVTAYNELQASERGLEGQSKISGTSLQFLRDTAAEAKKEFKLTTEASNQFTVELSKLTSKAGDVNKTGSAIGALMNLGAARGLSSAQALTAIGQAILGIDEGTDKLFNKNPSAIYAEYAASIGTTAGKLTDQQKAQALLNAVIEDGAKVQGEYNKYLESGAGKQEQFANAQRELKQAFGALLSGGLADVLPLLTDFTKHLTELPTSAQTAILAIGGITSALVALQVTGILPLIGSGFPKMISGIKSVSVALYALGGPVGIIIAVVSALGLLKLAHDSAAAAAAEHARREAELANIASQIATETVGMSAEQVQQIADREKQIVADLEKSIAGLQTKMDWERQKMANRMDVPAESIPETRLPGYDELEQNRQFLKVHRDRMAAYNERLAAIQAINAATSTGNGDPQLTAEKIQLETLKSIADATASEITDLVYQTEAYIAGLKQIIAEPGKLSKETLQGMNEELAAYQVRLDTLLSRREQLTRDIDLSGGAPERPGMESMAMEDMYLPEENDDLLKPAKKSVDGFASYYQSMINSSLDAVSSALAGSKNDWQGYFDSLKQMLIKMALTKALVSLIPGVGPLLGMAAPAAAASSGGSAVALGKAALDVSNVSMELSLLRSDLRGVLKNTLNRAVVVNVDGKNFVKSTVEPNMRYSKGSHY